MAKKEKIFPQVGGEFLVLSGSHYSGEVGYCLEALHSKQHGVMLRLELNDTVTWFKESEVKG